MFYISKNDIEYLKPPSQAEQIQHSSDYIKSGFDTYSKRNIFYGVDLDPSEQRHIDALRKEIEQAGIHLNKTWVDREILKYIYAAKFDIKKAFETITECLKWRAEVQSLSVTNSALELLYSGAIYTLGRDKQLRPILIINLEKIDTQNVNQNDMGMVATFFLDSVKEFSLLQGKIENLVLVIDGANKEFDNVAADKFEYILKKMVICHPTIVEKTYILNASNSLNRIWAEIQNVFEKETRSKVQFLSKSELNKLQENITSDQLEIKYGGSLTDLACYWPLCLISVNTSLATSPLLTGRPTSKSINISPQSEPVDKYISSGNAQYSTYSPEPKNYEKYTPTTYQYESPLPSYSAEKYVSSIPQYTSTYSPEPQTYEKYTSSSYQYDVPSTNTYEKYVSSSVPQYSTSYTPQTYDKYYTNDYQYSTSTPQYEKYVSSSYPQERYTSPSTYENVTTLEYDWKVAGEKYTSAAPVFTEKKQEGKDEPEKKEEQKESVTNSEGEGYDFNNDDLLHLIMGENNLLKDGKGNFKSSERENLYKPTEIDTKVKENDNNNENESPVTRETYYTDYSALRQEREKERETLLKSGISKTHVSQFNSPYSGRETAHTYFEQDSRNVTPNEKTDFHKNLKQKKEEDEDVEEEMESWGFCVSSRKKQIKAQTAN